MNFLSPDDIFSGVRRKSLCNGALLTLSSKNSNADSANSTPSKSKKERRRGSFNEATAAATTAAAATGRRSSLVSRWFKHISDAAEQYKPRSKNSNHEPVDDPAIATLPHSNTKESLELTPERPPPASATATVTTTPLAPMMMLPNNNHHYHNVELRNGRGGGSGDTTPSDIGSVSSMSVSVTSSAKNHLNNNELSSTAINRTMSTRSCGETNNNSNDSDKLLGELPHASNGVTLRHTQSARQANSNNNATHSGEDPTSAASKRDSTSIIYSNNSNNTRTLMQSSPPLVEPTAIQISISPAHTAEPVLTPAEKLRRLDASIRDGLYEKQKIICDMFRLPIEHFNEIVDIASLPEAPKDSADIALAAYAQVQSLTEVVNEYMKVTPEQEISAVSTSICDQCHAKKEQRRQQQHICSDREHNSNTAASASMAAAIKTQQQRARSPSPPPLPPPNKQQAQAQHKTAIPLAKLQTHTTPLDEQIILEDDDGYCEIDELRLPALPPLTPKSIAVSASQPPPPLPPPVGTFKTPPTPPPPPQTNVERTSSSTTGASPELTKRQSTISADSIPEESADEVTQAMDDEALNSSAAAATTKSKEVETETETIETHIESKEQELNVKLDKEDNNEDYDNAANDGEKSVQNSIVEEKSEQESEEAVVTAGDDSAATTSTTTMTTAEGDDNDHDEDDDDDDDDDVNDVDNEDDKNVQEKEIRDVATKTTEPPQRQNSAATTAADEESLNSSEHIEINDTYDTLAELNKLNTVLSMVDGMSQTILTGTGTITSNTHCGPNRIQHASSLEPSVPCHALNSIVTALNAQISLLLPKINERDMERERLRKENQHLRELLNAMHEHKRVQSKRVTPKDITTSADEKDEIDAAIKTNATTPSSSNSNTLIATTPTINTATTITNNSNEAASNANTETVKH